MLNCQTCRTDLEQVDATVRLDDRNHLLFCPLCGANLGNYKSERVFFDEKTNQYRFWVETHPDVTVTHEEHHGKFRLFVTAHVLSIYECLFERVFLLRGGDEPFGAGDPPHFSPVKPDSEHLLSSCKNIEHYNVSHSTRIYLVVTATGWEKSASLHYMEIEEMERNRGAALYVWPNFVAPGWNRYYVGFHPPAVPITFGSGSLDSVANLDPATGEQTKILKSSSGALGAQLDFVPSRIVLRWERSGIEYFSCWKTDLDRPNAPHLKSLVFKHADKVNFGFDFGTTNTAAAVSYELPEEQRIVLEPLAIGDRTLRLLNGVVGQNINWLPQPANDPLSTLPSQLLFEHPQFADSLSKTLQAPHQYTIPYYQAEDSAGSARSLGQFKWAKTLETLFSKALCVRHLYLRLALELFLAELVAKHRISPSNITLVATYPLAFDDKDMELHTNSFESVRPVLESATGFTIAIGPPLDESHAGLFGELTKIESESRYSLFIDVGGGTTDICISRRDVAIDTVLAIDSCEYGGEDLNSRICSDGLTQLSPQQFRCGIRTKGAQVFRSPLAFSNKTENWTGVKKIMVHFQRGLVETAARFAIAQTAFVEEDAPLFEIFMLGLGWFSVFANLTDAGIIAEEFCKRVQIRLGEIAANGLAAKIPQVRCIYPPNPKLIVALGAAECSNPDVAALSRDRKSYLLQDLEFVSGSQHQTLSWITQIPYKNSQEIKQLKVANLDRFTFESTVVLPGNISWSEIKLRDRILFPKDTIRHSPFRHFLASYKNAKSKNA